MAHLSPEGERATLALVAEQYATIVELRDALAAEQAGRMQDLETYTEALREAQDATGEETAS